MSNASLIFDIDETFVLAAVECLREAHLWKTSTQLPLTIPEQIVDASLAVPRSAIEIGHFHEVGPIEVVVDALRTQVLVQIEPLADEPGWVRLSQDCYALLNDTNLAGFLLVLRLPEEPLDEGLALALEGPVE